MVLCSQCNQLSYLDTELLQRRVFLQPLDVSDSQTHLCAERT